MDKEARFYDIVQKGVSLLASTHIYTQRNLLNKLETLGQAVSASTLSNIVNGNRAGLPVLKTAAQGIQQIIRQELDMEYAVEQAAFIQLHTPGWQPYIIPEDPHVARDQGYVLHVDGRVSIQQKTDFMAAAQKEVIEVGVRLKTFAGYFDSRRDSEYKDHITALLKRGVHVKAYLLDPNSNLALMYFDDRAGVQAAERDAVAESKKSLARLEQLEQYMARNNYPGSFKVFLYRHVPYNQFLAVDPDLEGGKMMIAHYMFGIRRAECPVLEFTRAKQPVLFHKYRESLRAFVKDARPLF
ncbi:MAG: hypothetical protein R3D58_04795 [Saprospiraceae bacterium]|nr:hypothetical protein [Lewinellaceae bacterium]